MQKIIKDMLDLGHEVNIIQIKPIERAIVLPPAMFMSPEKEEADEPKTRKKYARKNPNGNPPSLLTPEIVENMKKKRINWKTIAKIKKLKEEGYTSGRVSHKLGIDVEVINKYWNHE